MTTTVSTVAQSNISTSAPQQTQVKAEAPVEEALVKSAVPQIEPIQVDTQADRSVVD